MKPRFGVIDLVLAWMIGVVYGLTFAAYLL